ncbi:MAG: CCA tRNA nucleotidyltransferase [Clostridia bacterium]|nr:CCA tRNA nucleotidyltransferase [Clostridia bacterium]
MVQYNKMRICLPENLKSLADLCPKPLYAVGGYVRNFLIDGTVSDDLDIAASLSTEEIEKAAKLCGFKVVAEYKRTGTAVISDGKRKYEYTRFRTDFYGLGGGHKPAATMFTEDVALDARRRDFKCNAVYYDIKNDKIVDPLNGVCDIRDKILDTVIEPEKVFKSDGLRLLRLARFAAELNFTPTEKVLSGAKTYADNIRDIAPERIYEEIKKILVSDGKYKFSDKKGHYTGFVIMEKTGVLDVLFPELTAGRGMSQRVDFHRYDVLEHSLRTLMYADKSVRLAALFHDVGKPYRQLNCGTYKGHAEEGERIAREIMQRLKTDKRTAEKIAFLIRWHMFDINCGESERAVRRFIAENSGAIDALLKLKQADYSAGKDDFSVCPTVKRWTEILGAMKSDGTPFSVKDLKITAADLKKIGFKDKSIGEELKRLFLFAVDNPRFNEFTALEAQAKKDFKGCDFVA